MNSESADNRPRSTTILLVFTAAFAFAFGGFLFLGTWQLQRLSWKLDLIERVEARVNAAPVAAPPRAEWPTISAARDEYRHVRLDGHFIAGKDTRVQAVTAIGAGFWLLSPFQLDDGTIVLVNRGFIPPRWQSEAESPALTTVTGLLRLSETKGGFLRQNDPGADRWYARDVAAIANARGLQQVAPFFIDADFVGAPVVQGESVGGDAMAADPASWPRGGLTVIRFPNNHLVYALTWFALALMVAGAGAYVVREEMAIRKGTRLRSR
jgi:surfeit locus 1 family protein